jgi:predicted DNA-binding transcriptional regulator AlpA
MARSTLRELSLPRFALKRDEAAAALAISVGTFDAWVKDGIMPKGCKIRGNTLWDAEAVHGAWRKLADGETDEGANPFDEVVA